METVISTSNRLMKVLLLGLFFTAGASCGNNKVETKAVSLQSGGCFRAYVGELDQMLTQNDILKYYQIDFEKIEVEYDKKHIPEAYQQCLYSWESDNRKMKVSGMELPMHNHIGVGQLDFYSKEVKSPTIFFTSTYRFTEAEKAKAKEALSKRLEGNKESVKKMSKAMSKAFINGMKYEPVEGIGDAAVWDYLNSSLKVLSGHAHFDVVVNISDEVAVNQKLAKQLAKTILAKCP